MYSILYVENVVVSPNVANIMEIIPMINTGIILTIMKVVINYG